jgi:hypothetical protein
MRIWCVCGEERSLYVICPAQKVPSGILPSCVLEMQDGAMDSAQMARQMRQKEQKKGKVF